MSSVSFMDNLTDKLFPYSSKMKGESSKLSGSSNLMSINNSVSHPHRAFSADLLNGLIGDAIFNSETINPVISLKQPLGLLGGNYSFNFLNTKKPFSPHLSSLSLADTYRYKHGYSESFFPSDMLVSHIMNSVFLNQSSGMSQSLKSGLDTQKTFVPPRTEIKMPTSVSQLRTKEKSEISSSKCNMPNILTLNKELANRKTKEMHKRSKKRRRRQKKNKQFDCTSPASVSDDEVDSGVSSSITNCVCVVSENTKFGCTMAVQMVPNALSTFSVQVDTASDDDSEWESYGVDQCDSSSLSEKKADSSNLLASVSISSQVKTENLDFKCSQPIECECPEATSFISSFMVPVGSSSDDESDFEACETDIFNEIPDFEFTGLFITNLCTPQTPSFDADYSIMVSSEDEDDDETIKIRIHLREVNKNWNESTRGVEVKPKSSSKVSFAPDEALVEVFPVDVCERKGEWETYATERLRFKRKIDELEKILSPCLNPEHRSKVFKKLHEPIL